MHTILLSIAATQLLVLGERTLHRELGSQLTDDDGRYALVEGEAVTVAAPATKGGYHVATIKVTRIYTGPAKALAGLTFTQWTSDDFDDWDSTAPVLKTREKALWALFTNESGKWFTSQCFRNEDKADYTRRLEWADQVERLAKIKPVERIKEAMKLCGHKSPEAARLGVEVLLGAKETDAEKAGVHDFSKELVKNPDVTISALLHADRIKLRQKSDMWLLSEERKAWLSRLIRPPLSKEDADRVTWHLYLNQKHPSELVREIVKNDKNSVESRRAAIEAAVLIARRHGGYFGTPMLFEVLERETEVDLRTAAASGLAEISNPPKVLGAFTDDQIKSIQTLIGSEKDPRIKMDLQRALEKSKR